MCWTHYTSPYEKTHNKEGKAMGNRPFPPLSAGRALKNYAFHHRLMFFNAMGIKGLGGSP